MKIVRLRISNFRCVRSAEILPSKHNVYLGPNNSGKTAIMEALNLLLNPEGGYRSNIIDENDFYCRRYIVPPSPPASTQTDQPNEDPGASPAQAADSSTELNSNQEETTPSPSTTVPTIDQPAIQSPDSENPRIRIEAVIASLNQEDEDFFKTELVPWRADTVSVIEEAAEGSDPFSGAQVAIRVVFEGWYDQEEDGFATRTFFLKREGTPPEECSDFGRKHKRHIGFLIYRDFRGLTRPVTLDASGLFARILQSQSITPHQFERVLGQLGGALDPMIGDPEFASILNSYKAELEGFLSLSTTESSALSFEFTDRTRIELKEAAQLFVKDEIALPLQSMGAGTRSLAILAMLTLVMRRRQRGILALEEPETFLFPHAQRRVIDECLRLADQTFTTTHSPYILERLPFEGIIRIKREKSGLIHCLAAPDSDVKQLNLYSKRLRQAFCEALLGKSVVLVEGDSDRCWISGASRLMHKISYQEEIHEAFELDGISIVNTDSNGDLSKFGDFFEAAGLRVICVVDQVKDSGLVQSLCEKSFLSIFLGYSGLEDLLSEELPLDIVRISLTRPEHCKTPPLSDADAASLTEESLRERFQAQLIANKGSLYFHEWLLSLLNENSIPLSIKELVSHIRSATRSPRSGAFSMVVYQ